MRKSSTLLTRLLIVLFSFSLIAAACGDDDTVSGSDDGGTTDGGGAEGGEFIDGAQLSSVPPHIDPYLTSELNGAQISTALYDGLTEVAYVSTGPEIRPLAAESWTSNADASVFTFTIKDGLKFSDGTSVLPSSFKKGWDISASPELAGDYSYLFSLVAGFAEIQDGTSPELSGVVADDAAMTLTVTLAAPYADFPAVVSHITFAPMPEARFALSDQSQWELGVMIGNGPYAMEAAKNDQQIVLVRNDNWAGDVYGNTKANLDRIVFRISSDLDSAYAAFEAGETMSAVIPPGKFTEATTNYGYKAGAQLASYHWVIGMRDEDPLGGADKALLRQAINAAIDRVAINNAVYDGSRVPATSVTPPGIPGFQADFCANCTQNVENAKALLKQYTDGGGVIPDNIVLTFGAGQGHEDVAALVQQDLETVLGITTTQEPRDASTYFKSLREGGCPGLCRAGWTYDYPIYDNGMFDLFHTDAGGNNLGKYSNPTFDEDVNVARTIVDDEARFAKFREAENQLLNIDSAVVPIVWYQNKQVYDQTKVAVYGEEPGGFVRFETVALVAG